MCFPPCGAHAAARWRGGGAGGCAHNDRGNERWGRGRQAANSREPLGAAPSLLWTGRTAAKRKPRRFLDSSLPAPPKPAHPPKSSRHCSLAAALRAYASPPALTARYPIHMQQLSTLMALFPMWMLAELRVRKTCTALLCLGTGRRRRQRAGPRENWLGQAGRQTRAQSQKGTLCTAEL